MTRREIRANRARVVGNILPVYSEMMKTHNYEYFNCKQEENGSATFKDIHSTTRNLYSLNRGDYYITNLLNWICEKPRSGTGLTGNNLQKVSLNTDGSVNIGRGYLTIYRTPVIYDITNNLNPESFIFTVELSFDSEYAYTLLGFINSAGNNVSPGISKKLSNLVSYFNKDNESHTLEFKGKQGIVYLFLDGLYTGQYLDITGQTRDLMCAFYMGSASSSYNGINVSDIRLEPMSSIYPATYLGSNTDVWVIDKVKNGTSVAEADRVAPHINPDTKRMNAGRGYCVYLKKGIINPYNQELYETGFTLSCEVFWDTGTGQEVLFGQLNSDGTDIIGAFKKSLNELCDKSDLTDKLKLEWKYKGGQAYLFVNGKYTGATRELTGMNHMLGMYNSKDLTPSNVDGVELYNIQIDNTVNIFPFTYQFLNLDNWEYKQYAGSTSTSLKEPTLVDNDERVDIGGSHYAYLNAPLMIYDNVDYNITLTFTGNYQRVGLGRITFVDGTKIKPTGIDRLIYDFTANTDNPHMITYKVLNQVAYLYVDYKYTGVKYDFTEEIYNIFMGFYDNSTTTGIKIHNMEAVKGTITSPPSETYFPMGVTSNWAELPLSNANGTPQPNSWGKDGLTLGAYKRNIYKVPFKRANKYEVTFHRAGSYYMGIANSYTNLSDYDSIQVINSNNFSNGQNTVLFEFDGENVILTINGAKTVELTMSSESGDDIYFMELQNNDNSPMVINEIKETKIATRFNYTDFTFEDIGMGENHLSISTTGAVLGYGGLYYYNTPLMNEVTYEIKFKYGELCYFGLQDTKDTTTSNMMSEYQLPEEHLHLDGSINTLLIKTNGGRVTYNLNNGADVYIDHGLTEGYESLYLYQHSDGSGINAMVITEIREYGGS